MADEISDSRFKSEMMRLMNNVIGKFDEVDKRFDEVDRRFEGVDNRLGSLQSDFRALSRQFNDVGVMAIKDNQRIDVLEKRVDELDAGVH